MMIAVCQLMNNRPRSPLTITVSSLLNAITITVMMAIPLGCSSQSGRYTGASGDPGGGNVGFGGAQDIGQFRSLLEDGQIPGPATLDANGFFAEHRTELPPPNCGELLCVQSMLSQGVSWLANQQQTPERQTTLQIALNTPIDPTTLVRKPLNMVVVVDTSGSMAQDNRLVYVKQGLHLLTDGLNADDRLSVVTYSSNASIRQPLSVLDRAKLHQLIDSLEPAGSTNIYDGLETALQQAATHFDSERQNRVVLLSDGLATSGITSDSEILTMASTFIADGIGLTTIGVGRDFNVELMRSLSERGSGNFYFVENSMAVTEVFTEELNYFVTPLAFGVRIEVATEGEFSLGNVVGTKLWKTSKQGGEIFIPAVFVASRTADETPNGRRGGGGAIFIDVQTADDNQPVSSATITLSYRDPTASDPNERIYQSVKIETPATVGEDLYVSESAMAEHYAVYNMFLGLKRATENAKQGYYNCATASLQSTDYAARKWNSTHSDSDIADDIELIEMFRNNLKQKGAGTQTCDDDYEEGDNVEYGDEYEYGACSFAGDRAPSGMVILGLAIILGCGGFRRRQRLDNIA